MRITIETDCTYRSNMTAKDFQKSVLLSLLVSCVIFFVAILLTIYTRTTPNNAVGFVNDFDQTGDLKAIVSKSLEDGDLSFTEKMRIYFEKERQKDMLQLRIDQEYQKSILIEH